MKKPALLAVLAAGTSILGHAPANAHDWYPSECCHHEDCVPVDSVVRLTPTRFGATPQLIVTSKHGITLVPEGFPVRESKDGRMHICARADPYGDKGLMCLFVPPSM
jgi:hypothetical protein